jgi:hypothetical protein
MYRVVIFFVVFASLCNSSTAQNLVPNPSFESISNCPSGLSQITNATGWDRPNGAITTPDLLHSCASTLGTCAVSLPGLGALAGTLLAHNGAAASGIITQYDACPNCREYIQIRLTAPLVVGTTYRVEYYVSCSPNSKYETDGLDCFIGGNISQPGNQPIISTIPQISSPIITKNMGWTLISRTYTALGGEEYLTIGNFVDDAATNSNIVAGAGCALANLGGYYLIDDVSVEVDVLLDMTLKVLEVNSINKNNSYLKWDLGDIGNYENLVIEHSTDGITFSEIAELKIELIGDYIHISPALGDNYYRLQLRKMDGTVVFTNMKVITFNGIEDRYIIYPNPFEDELRIEIPNHNLTTRFIFKFLNITGQVVYEEEVSLEEGRHSIILKLPNKLPSGTYILNISNDKGFEKHQQLIKR